MSLTEVQFSGTTVEQAPARAIQGRSPWQLTWRRLRSDRVAVASAIVIVLLCLVALAAPLIASLVGHPPAIQYSYGTTDQGLPKPPGAQFLLGTDNLGRDLFVRIVYGARVSLLVGLSSTFIATVLGVTVGLIAGYYGGVIDGVLARGMDVVLAFPYLILALALVTVLGPSLWMVIAVIAFFSWAALARIVRGQTLSLKEKEYIEAARAIGASPLRIMVIDILPNVIAPVLVVATLLVPTAIVFESTLSYLGLGIQEPMTSWGVLIQLGADQMETAPWLLIFPALFMAVTLFCFNFIGDGLRDALDPRDR